MESALHAVALRLPPPLRRQATEARVRLLAEFVRFGLVGCSALVVDTAVVYALRGWLGLVGAGLASYLVAVTFTYVLNRAWTFAGRGSGPVHRQWAAFALVNLAGFALNRGTYTLLVTLSPLCMAYPFLATSAGAIAGMGVNFTLSRRLVFR